MRRRERVKCHSDEEEVLGEGDGEDLGEEVVGPEVGDLAAAAWVVVYVCQFVAEYKGLSLRVGVRA